MGTIKLGPIVEIRHLNKWFGPHHVLKDISLSITEKSVTCIIGPSGSGKSTMLRCINLLEKPDSGEVIVLGEHMGYSREGNDLRALSPNRISAQRSNIGMVFQRFNLFPHLTAIGNVMEAPMVVHGLAREKARELALKHLTQVGLADKANRYPSELSGGQMQRVAIARALIMKPRLILFDEPTSALDPELVGEVLAVMRELAHGGITMVIVTHEISFAREIADDMIFMADGRIVERAHPQQMIERPQESRTREFLHRITA